MSLGEPVFACTVNILCAVTLAKFSLLRTSRHLGTRSLDQRTHLRNPEVGITVLFDMKVREGVVQEH